MILYSKHLLGPTLLACCLCFEVAGAATRVADGAVAATPAPATPATATAEVTRARPTGVARSSATHLGCSWTSVADPRHPEYPPKLVVQLVLNRPTREPIARDQVARDTVARDQVARDQVERNQVARNQVAREGPAQAPSGACASAQIFSSRRAAVEAAVVHKAATIAMVEQSEHARVTLSVVALEEGAIGSVIRCRSSLAGTILLGRVVDGTTVERIAPEKRVQW